MPHHDMSVAAMISLSCVGKCISQLDGASRNSLQSAVWPQLDHSKRRLSQFKHLRARSTSISENFTCKDMPNWVPAADQDTRGGTQCHPDVPATPSSMYPQPTNA
eukprot:6459364-Amphidinium_carterae.1